MQHWQKYAAEAYGTFVLVAVGSGAILAAAAASTGAFTVAVSFGFGLALIAALYSVAAVSGGHFNPAISLAAFLDRRIGAADMVGYMLAQVSGAILASLSLAWIIDTDAVAATVTKVGRDLGVDSLGGVVGEVILTTIFVFAVLVLSKSRAYSKFLGIGLTLTAVHLIGVPLTGASVNPARSFAPALVGTDFTDFWIYLVGPALGAVLGWVLYKVIAEGDTDFSDDVSEIKDSVV